MSRDLRNASIVVVGASSGLGRASALAFADHGARLVLVARSRTALEEVAAECRERSAQALVLPADVSEADAMEAVARAAVGAYGGLDVWVHAAAVLLAARFGDEPTDELRRVVDTNVLGAFNAARAAMSVFEDQGHGTLVLVSSVLAEVVNPLVVSYVMTKFAVLGLARSLQQIVAHQPRVRVSVVLPGPLDTPMFQRAANHTGRELRSVPPASSPERAAAAVVKAARRAPRQVPVGAAARVVLLAHRIAPRLADYVVAQWSGRLITRSVPAPATPGVLRAPAPTGQTDGGWRRAGWRRRAGDLAGRRLARRHASRAA